MDNRLAAAVAATACVTAVCLTGCAARTTPGPDASPARTAGPASFHPPTTSPRPPHALNGPGVPYDFTGDGKADLVMTDTNATVNGKYAAGYAAVLPGSATGPDAAHAKVLTQDGIGEGPAGQGGGFGNGAVSADLDGDGYSDLATQAGGNTVFVVWGGPHKSGPARLAGRAPLAGDMDGDGHADLVTTGTTPYSAVISYGPFTRAGAPARTASVTLAVDQPADSPGFFSDAYPVAVGDMNGDGRDDLVVTWSHVYADEIKTPRATAVYLGAASGVTRGARLKDAQGADMYSATYGHQIATGDVNHDGKDDVVIGLSYDIVGDESTPKGGTRLMVSYGGPGGASTRSRR